MENQRINDKIEGRNPVLEALKADREIDKIYVQNHFKDPVMYACKFKKNTRFESGKAEA